MELRLANKESAINAKNNINVKKISIEEVLKESECAIYYFDKENSTKDVLKFKSALEKKGRSVYLNEVRYTLDENDYIYEMHVL